MRNRTRRITGNWGAIGGLDLPRELVHFDTFIEFVRKSIVPAPESLRFQFRLGFMTGYGQHAEEALDRAFGVEEMKSEPADKSASARYGLIQLGGIGL